jgi:cytochrome c
MIMSRGKPTMSAHRPYRLLASAMLLTGLAACSAEKTAEAPAATMTTETTVVETAPPAVPVAADPAPAPVAEAAMPAATPAAAAPATGGVTLASLTGDAAKGEKVFGQCKTCHVAEKGVNRIGPSLWAVVGRTAGSIADYKYSVANKNSGLTWSDTQLFTYLEAPQKVVPGTKMAFAGLKKPQDRADVIAYLKTRA